MPQFTMPQFTMPQFTMPQFTMPQFTSGYGPFESDHGSPSRILAGGVRSRTAPQQV